MSRLTKRMHTNRRPAFQFRCSGFFGRWIRSQRPSPAAVGDLGRCPMIIKCDTKSEELFVAICERHGYKVSKMPTRSAENLKTADFSVLTPHGQFVAEIEELTPNKDDLRQIREMKETGSTSGGGKIGERARRAIRHAAAQLRQHRAEKIPLIAVLYDNVRTTDGRVAYPMLHVEQHHIDTAMYGARVVHVPLQQGASPRFDRNGGGRTTTHDEKTYVSAVGVISDWDGETLFVYHNCYAEIPLPRSTFIDEKCHHYRKGAAPHSEPWTWYALPKG